MAKASKTDWKSEWTFSYPLLNSYGVEYVHDEQNDGVVMIITFTSDSGEAKYMGEQMVSPMKRMMN